LLLLQQYGKTVAASFVKLSALNSPGGGTLQFGTGRGLLCLAPRVLVK